MVLVPFYGWGNWGSSINGLSRTATREPELEFEAFPCQSWGCVVWLSPKYKNHGNKKPCSRIISVLYYCYYFYRLQLWYASSSFCFIPRNERFQMKHRIMKWWYRIRQKNNQWSILFNTRKAKEKKTLFRPKSIKKKRKKNKTYFGDALSDIMLVLFQISQKKYVIKLKPVNPATINRGWYKQKTLGPEPLVKSHSFLSLERSCTEQDISLGAEDGENWGFTAVLRGTIAPPIWCFAIQISSVS